MIIGNPSSSSIAASVWTYTGTRGITSLASAGTRFNANPSVGAGVVLDLRPAAGKIREWEMQGCVATTFVGGYYDGATFTNNNINIGPNIWWHGFGDSVIGASIKNTSAGAVSFIYIGIDWS